jgi:uncharacterized membrane protein
MKEPKDTSGIRLSETTRLEAFSDGIFAIVITLLVLELIQLLHSHGGEQLTLSSLLHWEPYVAFFVGFVTVLICWINHHHVFDHIAKTDSSLMWVNGFVLFFITLTPFPTAILAELIKTDATTAFAIFGANYLLIAIGSYAICAYPYRKGLIETEDREYFRYIKRTYGYSIIYTMIAFGVCFISVWLAAVLYAGLFMAFAFPKEFASRLMRRSTK